MLRGMLGRFTDTQFFCNSTSCSAKGAAHTSFVRLQTLLGNFGYRGPTDGKITPTFAAALSKAPVNYGTLAPGREGFDMVFVAEYAHELGDALALALQQATGEGFTTGIPSKNPVTPPPAVVPAKPFLPPVPMQPVAPPLPPPPPDPVDTSNYPVPSTQPVTVTSPLPVIDTRPSSVLPSATTAITDKLTAFYAAHKQRVIVGGVAVGIAALLGAGTLAYHKRKRRAVAA